MAVHWVFRAPTKHVEDHFEAQHGDPFAVFAEKVAKGIGTKPFLIWQTVIVLVWIGLNLAAFGFQWDPYPFILLNLAFSTQAAYAAPFIIFVGNRAEKRDKVRSDVQFENDVRSRVYADAIARKIGVDIDQAEATVATLLTDEARKEAAAA